MKKAKCLGTFISICLLCVICASAFADVDITVYPLEITLVHIEKENLTDDGNNVKFEVKFTGGTGPYTCRMGLFDHEQRLITKASSIGSVDTDGFGWEVEITQSGDYCVEVVIMGSDGEMVSSYPNWMYIDAGDSPNPVKPANPSNQPYFEPTTDIPQEDSSEDTSSIDHAFLEITIPRNENYDTSPGIDITIEPLEIQLIHIREQQYTSNGNEIEFEVKFSGGTGPYLCTMYLLDMNDNMIGHTNIGPANTDGFGWYYTITKSGNYRVEAEITDDEGKKQSGSSEWLIIDSGLSVDITQRNENDAEQRENAGDHSYIDITTAPEALRVTSVHIKKENHVSNGNEIKFEAKFIGGEGPYTCEMQLVDKNGVLVSVGNIGPANTDGFGWTELVRQSGRYVVYAVITDSAGNHSSLYSDWLDIDAAFTLDITEPQDDLDITIAAEPLQVTSVRIEKEQFVADGNEVTFEAKFIGGEGPYTCEMQLVDENGALVSVGNIGPAITDGFGWTELVRQSGRYIVHAVIIDSAGSHSSLYSDWLSITIPQKDTVAKNKQQAFVDTVKDQYNSNKGESWHKSENPFLPGADWCAAFIHQCAQLADANDCMYSSSNNCTALTVHYANKNRFYNTSNHKTWSESGYAQLASPESYHMGHAQDFMPQIGDLILFETIGSWNDGPDHIGVVVDVPDENNVTIIEGNATVSGSGNKRKARIEKRTISWRNGSNKVYGFCRPDYDR